MYSGFVPTVVEAEAALSQQWGTTEADMLSKSSVHGKEVMCSHGFASTVTSSK